MKKILSIVLALALCLSLGATAFASGEGSGGMGGSSNLAGMLSTAGNVVENDGAAEASFTVYGVFKAGGEGEAAFVIDQDCDPASLTYTVYTDREMTKEAAGVTAAVADGVLTVSGIATDANTAYYIGSNYPAEAVAPTVIYVVNDQYDAPVDYALNDGATIALSEYAPGIASESKSNIYIGANSTLLSAADYDITDPDDAAIADWWLGSGITTAGSTLEDFGETFYRFELSVALYREFQIVIEENTTTASIGGDFVEPTDVNGAMGSNDQFSDSISATLYAGVWDGIYTVMNDEGYLENIDGLTEFGGNIPVDEETLFVALYNAFVTPWAQLNEAGKTVAAGLNAATNAEKVEQIKAALGLEDWSVDNYSTQKLAVLAVLMEADNYIAMKEYPDAALQEAAEAAGYAVVEAAPADMTAIQEGIAATVINGDTEIVGEDLTTEYPTSLFVKGGHVRIVDSTIASSGLNTDAGPEGYSANEILGIVSGMPSVSEIGYNMTLANACYRDAFGANLIAWGYDTIVELGTTTGELVISAPSNGSMAGGLYNGFGASILIEGATAFSAGQHLSNTLYNGTIHYRNANAIGAGRMFSSDFWGGNVVYENTIAAGGDVTDEPTAVVVKNSVFKGTVSMNGYATVYFENSLIEGGNFGTQNNTSLVSDAASITLVNSVMDGSSFLSVNRSSHVIAKLVDSQVKLSGSNLVSMSMGNYGTGNLGDEGFYEMFQTDAKIYVYGDSGIFFDGDELTVNVAEDQSLTLYVKEIVGGEIENIGGGRFEIVTGDEYGTLYLNTEYDLPAHGAAAAEAEEAVPATDGTENQANTLAGDAQPATQEEYDAYEAYLVEYMTNYDGVGDGTFDDSARAMALGELDSVGFGADVNGFPFEMYVTQFGAMDYATFAAQN